MPLALLQQVETTVDELLTETEQFHGLSRSRWAYGAEGKVFLRVNRRCLQPGSSEMMPVIELATIDIEEGHQGKGLFRKVLTCLEAKAVAAGRGVFVENTVNEILEDAMRRYGYQQREHCEPPCFWKGPAELIAQPAKKFKP